jgi:FkbH-like protein
MKRSSLLQIHKTLSTSTLDELPKLNIAILRNIVVEPIEVYLKFFVFQMGYNANVYYGEYDNILQEALDWNDKEIKKEDLDCILIFMKLENISWDLSRNFCALSGQETQNEISRVKNYIASVIGGLCRQTNAVILFQGFEYPTEPAFGIIDSQNKDGQYHAIRKINDYIIDLVQTESNVHFVDSNICCSRIGSVNYYDHRYWHIGRAPYTKNGLEEIAFENVKFISAIKGKNKKCLVLDCDNTLWGGIVAEDGLTGIKLGKTYPGSSYYEFQQEIVNLHNRGVIIALCSKNNPQDVWDVFQKHPEMVLKEEHIAAWQINWNDKAMNLRQISLDLNISTDSMVFVDDSEFEINLIREMMPEVTTIHLPEQMATRYRQILASYGLFDTITVSEEDRKRGAMYKAEAGRRVLKAEVTDIESYYVSLEMVVEVRFADEYAIPRISQLTQKTNQFNLTTRRYNEAEIKSFCDADDSDVIYLKVSDKLGEAGIVGTCILRYEGKKITFDTFLLSCRVLGRGVEDAFIVQALKLARIRGCENAIGEYIRTNKNMQVKNFYSRHGFKELEYTPGSDGMLFIYDLGNDIKKEPQYFKEIDSEIDQEIANSN